MHFSNLGHFRGEMMQTSTDTVDQQAIDAINTEISFLNNGLGYWIGEEVEHNNRATKLRETADGIDLNAAPLQNILRPIWDFHTSNTWEGGAATRSRTRLGTHEERISDVITTLNRLVADLDAEAALEEGLASEAGAQVSAFRVQLSSARTELAELRE